MKDFLVPQGEDNELRKALEARFSKALPELFRYFNDPEVCSCLIILAGFLKPNTIPQFR